MNNGNNTSYNMTRGNKTMNLKYWGGWFLAVACVCIFLTMGCEKGHLGVKPASVMGRLVNKDNVSVGVANATVRMVSKENVGTGELQQGYNFLSAVTDENGYFMFENCSPDNVIFEFEAPGYQKTLYPDKSSSSEESGSSSSSDIESVSIHSGEVVDLKNILMRKISNPLPSTVTVKFQFVDAKMHTKVDDSCLFEVVINGKAYTKTAGMWNAIGQIDVPSENSAKITVRNSDEVVKYEVWEKEVSLTTDIYQIIEIQPLTYSLSFHCVNIPDYIVNDGIKMDFIAEIPAEGSKPSQKISETASVTRNLNECFATMDVSGIGISKNLNIIIRTEGYSDEIVNIPSASLKQGDQGNYRIDIDFKRDDSWALNINGVVEFERIQNANEKLGLADNIIKKDIVVHFIGLAVDTKVWFEPSIKADSYEWSTTAGADVSVLRDGGRVTSSGLSLKMNGIPVGYSLDYSANIDNKAIKTPGDSKLKILTDIDDYNIYLGD